MPVPKFPDPSKRPVPEQFRAVLEEAFEITGNPEDTVLSFDLKSYVLSRRPEWGSYTGPWFSINFTKIGLGNVHKNYPVRTGVRRRTSPVAVQ
jgi:hypothetical protein